MFGKNKKPKGEPEKDSLDILDVENGEEEVLTRAEMREKLKREKGKSEEVVENEEEPSIEEAARLEEEEILKAYKKKKRKHKFILFSVSLLALAAAGGGTYYYLYDTKLQEEQTIESLYGLYAKAFTDEEKTEIIKALSEKQYTHIANMYADLPNSTEKMEFGQWQEVLDAQFKNQQAVLKAIDKIQEKEGYIAADATEEDFTTIAELLTKPFNAEYMEELKGNTALLRTEFDYMKEVQGRVDAFYGEDGILQEFDQDYFDKLTVDIEKLTNPEVKALLKQTVEETHVEWKAREEEREKQRIKDEEEARILAEEEAERKAEEERIRKEAEEEARAEAEERERIKEEARREVEAELEAERAKLEEEQAKQESENAESSQASNPATTSLGANKIGINGVYKTYVNLGKSTTSTIQSSIDAGNITAALTKFNGTDNQTTYFGGHNPGVMSFMDANITKGSIVTVTDSNGTKHNYKMLDKVDTTVDGKEILPSIGLSALEVFNNGSGKESILIQFCNPDDTMSYWYGEAH